MSDFVRHSSCPSCGSKDNLAVYSDGHGHCFGCGHWIPPTDLSEFSFSERKDYMNTPVKVQRESPVRIGIVEGSKKPTKSQFFFKES